MKFSSIALLLGACLAISACKTPDISVPKFSLTRETPAPVVQGAQRIQRQAIPANRLIDVQPNDTIYTLATRYQVTPQSLISDNQLSSPYRLTAGTKLKITPRREHIVTPTDSLLVISQRYAVSQYHLAELNELSEPYELVIGQRLLVPDTHDFSVLDGSKGVDTKLVRPIASPNQAAVVTSAVARPAPTVQKPTKSFVAPAFAAGDGFTWPLEGEIIADFGPAGRGLHNDGVNIRAELGTAVQTAAPGTIAYIGRNLKSFGSLVLVKHDGGYITAYAHLDEIIVNEGDVIGAGQKIGTVGQTGRVSNPQLHFEVRLSRQPINPHEVITS